MLTFGLVAAVSVELAGCAHTDKSYPPPSLPTVFRVCAHVEGFDPADTETALKLTDVMLHRNGFELSSNTDCDVTLKYTLLWVRLEPVRCSLIYCSAPYPYWHQNGIVSVVYRGASVVDREQVNLWRYVSRVRSIEGAMHAMTERLYGNFQSPQIP